jgi:hypothetical protein
MVAPLIALGTFVLAVVGVKDWRLQPWRALAFSIPCVSTIVLYEVILERSMTNLEPPLYIGIWLVFLAVYCTALAVCGRRKQRA